MTLGASLTLADAAEQLGVHYQTAYRWVRQGVLPASKVGGAYEVDHDAVVALRRQRAVPAPPPPRRRVRSWEPYARRLLDMLLAGDDSRVRELFDNLRVSGVSVADLCDHVLAPALVEVGEHWRDGSLSIAEEHRASAICERALARWSAAPPGRPRGTAVVCSPPTDEHQLPGQMATAVLRSGRWRVHHLGTGVPPDAIAELAAAERADLVVVSVTLPSAVPEAGLLAELLVSPGRRILVGRPGMTMARLVALTAPEAGGTDRRPGPPGSNGLAREDGVTLGTG